MPKTLGPVGRVRSKIGHSLPRFARDILAAGAARGRAELYQKEGRHDKAKLIRKWSNEILAGQRKLRESVTLIELLSERKRSAYDLMLKHYAYGAVADRLSHDWHHTLSRDRASLTPGEAAISGYVAKRIRRARKASDLAKRMAVQQHGSRGQMQLSVGMRPQ